jgi:uncharacterized membrane protein
MNGVHRIDHDGKPEQAAHNIEYSVVQMGADETQTIVLSIGVVFDNGGVGVGWWSVKKNNKRFQ